MKLGRLLLLAGAAVAANQFLKTDKGRQLKRDVSDQAGKLKDKLSGMMDRSGHTSGRSDSGSTPTGSSFTGGGGPI